MNPTIMVAIESPEFSANVNVVSGYKQFLRAIEGSKDIQELRKQISGPDDLVELLCRAFFLMNLPCDEAHENPYDVAVATYLFVLSQVDLEAAKSLAAQVRWRSGFWWARKFAEKLEQEHKKQMSPSRFNARPLGTGKAETSLNYDVFYGPEMTIVSRGLPTGYHRRYKGSFSGIVSSGKPTRNVGAKTRFWGESVLIGKPREKFAVPMQYFPGVGVIPLGKANLLSGPKEG